MQTYIIKPKTIKKSEMLEKECSFSSRDFRKLFENNNSFFVLKDFLENVQKVGREIGSEAYMKKSKYRFLKTVNLSSNFLLNETSIEYCKPQNKIFPKKNEILIAKDGGGDGLGEVAFYPYENKDNFDSLSAGIVAIKIKEEKRNYVLGFLKSQHFKNFIDLNTAQGSTIRHSKLVALSYKIPFPTTANNLNPENVEKMIALIVQNILDKEEQIKIKNEKIDELIEKELKENQKENDFKYNYPKISEMKKEGRLDTGLYEKKFKEIEILIKNYSGGFTELSKFKIKTGRTPKDYFYTKHIPNKTYFWLTPKYIKKNIFISKQYLFTKQKTNLDDGDLIFTGIGTGSQGHLLYYDKQNLGTVFINQNTYAISMNTEKTNKIFTLCFLSSRILKEVIQKLTSKGSVPAIYPRDIARIKIPNFPEIKQQEIAKLYYNHLEKNENITFENYLTKEKQRNADLGIFQLNMEIFSLREKLENLVHKIVMSEKIELEF